MSKNNLGQRIGKGKGRLGYKIVLHTLALLGLLAIWDQIPGIQLKFHATLIILLLVLMTLSTLALVRFWVIGRNLRRHQEAMIEESAKRTSTPSIPEPRKPQKPKANRFNPNPQRKRNDEKILEFQVKGDMVETAEGVYETRLHSVKQSESQVIAHLKSQFKRHKPDTPTIMRMMNQYEAYPYIMKFLEKEHNKEALRPVKSKEENDSFLHQLEDIDFTSPDLKL